MNKTADRVNKTLHSRHTCPLTSVSNAVDTKRKCSLISAISYLICISSSASPEPVSVWPLLSTCLRLPACIVTKYYYFTRTTSDPNDYFNLYILLKGLLLVSLIVTCKPRPNVSFPSTIPQPSLCCLCCYLISFFTRTIRLMTLGLILV